MPAIEATTAAGPARAPAPAVAIGSRKDELRRDVLATLSAAPMMDRPTLMRRYVVAASGILMEPREVSGSWGPKDWQVTLLGVTGLGDSLTEAVSDWMTCARRMQRGA